MSHRAMSHSTTSNSAPSNRAGGAFQQCTDSDGAMQALERFQAQGRYENLRLLKIDQNDWEEPVGHTIMREYHSGHRLSEDDTVEQTRALRSTERRKRIRRALPRQSALALTFFASIGIGVLVATF